MKNIIYPDLKNKNVLITGATGGIGKVIVKKFKNSNANVFEIGRSKKPKNGFSCNLENEIEVENIFNGLKKIDVVIACAGQYVSSNVPLENMPLSQWEKTMSNNLTSVFLTTKYFLKNIKKYKPKTPTLILIGSTAGVFGEANHADYATAKAGLYGFLKSLKNEIVQLEKNARVNLIAPGWTITEMARELLNDKAAIKKTLQTIPLKKLATPSDVANACLFFSSFEASGHISGEVFKVCGGMEGRVLFDQKEIHFSS